MINHIYAEILVQWHHGARNRQTWRSLLNFQSLPKIKRIVIAVVVAKEKRKRGTVFKKEEKISWRTRLFKESSVFSLDSKWKISHSPDDYGIMLNTLPSYSIANTEVLFLGAWGVCDLQSPSAGLWGIQDSSKCAFYVCNVYFVLKRFIAFINSSRNSLTPKSLKSLLLMKHSSSKNTDIKQRIHYS